MNRRRLAEQAITEELLSIEIEVEVSVLCRQHAHDAGNRADGAGQVFCDDAGRLSQHASELKCDRDSEIPQRPRWWDLDREGWNLRQVESMPDGFGNGIVDGVLTVRLGALCHAVGRVDDLPLPGPHNRLNALAATSAALCAGATPERMARSLSTLGALPHRLETVLERGGVRYVNDSKATNIASAAMALQSFPAATVHAIVGGHDKGADFALLAADLTEHARAVYAIGEAGPRIAAALGPVLQGAVELHTFPDLATAFAAATVAADPGDTILLAPACASFDGYENFEARGRHFRALAEQYGREV